MAFESHPRHAVAAGALLLAAGAWHAGGAGSAGVAAAACLAGAGLVWCGLAAFGQAQRLAPLEVAVGLTPDQARSAARVLALEAQLEHAPIALFLVHELVHDLVHAPVHDRVHDRVHDSVHTAVAGVRVEAVNANARRLLAPGRATDPASVHRTLATLAAGQRKVIDFDTEHGAERALATAGAMTVEGQPQRLVALMPMEDELEAEAMQAWQKLVHVLTHEIMNSLTPVASLSRTSRDLLAGAALPPDIAQDLDIALDAISRRADSLTHFVGGYRALASVPEARRQRVVVADMFARLSALVAPAWQARGGRADFIVEPGSLELMADPGQLEQALVNLLKNADEATAHLAAPQVSVSARLARGGRLRIEVADNGPGVRDDVAADIFTPFFTTKLSRGGGGGIGLALVRQLVHRNGGAVRHARPIGPGARFIMTF